MIEASAESYSIAALVFGMTIAGLFMDIGFMRGFRVMADKVYNKTTEPDPSLAVPLLVRFSNLSNPELITDFYLRHRPLQVESINPEVFNKVSVFNSTNGRDDRKALRSILASASTGSWGSAEEILAKLQELEQKRTAPPKNDSLLNRLDNFAEANNVLYLTDVEKLSAAVATHDESTVRLSEPYLKFFEKERKAAILKCRILPVFIVCFSILVVASLYVLIAFRR